MGTRKRPSVDSLLKKIRDDFDIAAASLNASFIEFGLEAEKHTQTLGDAEPLDDLPTLDTNECRAMTPMLRRRFEFCGRWRRFDETWLSTTQMETVRRNSQFKRHFKAKRDYWDNSAPATVPPERLSVFSVSSHADGDPGLAESRNRRTPTVAV